VNQVLTEAIEMAGGALHTEEMLGKKITIP
jgi:hypothetical protein